MAFISHVKKARLYAGAFTGLFWCLLLFLFTANGIWGCAKIAVFDQYAYDQAVIIKFETLQLFDSAEEDFSLHEPEVLALTEKIEALYLYEKERPNNEITVRMWEILKDPEKNLVGGVIRLWRQQGTLSRAYIEEKKIEIASAFEQIISLEASKKKPE